MKFDKINHEITKIKAKITEYQNRLRELERQKTEMENTEIVAMVRSFDVPPEHLRALIEAYQKQNTNTADEANAKEETENEE